jgi:hypothetical protein
MVLMFILLFLFDVVVGVLVFLGWQRVTAHLRANPEAARLVAEHVIAPLLTGKTDKPEMKKTKGTLV